MGGFQFPNKNDYWQCKLPGGSMDALTAAAAVLAVQLAVALIMTGTFYASPGERCTRYWALSGLLSAIGVLIVIINAGSPRLLLSTAGNSAIIAARVLQWWGVRAFYGKRRSSLGWLVIGGFFVLFAYSLASGQPLRNRALLTSIAMAVVYALNLFELWNTRSGRTSFAGTLVLSTALLTVLAFITRAVAVFRNNPQFLPDTAAGFGVVVVYLVPMVTTLLFTMALMLLYFERLISDKHRMATQDELTGLHNRRAIVSAGQREIDVAPISRSSAATGARNSALFSLAWTGKGCACWPSACWLRSGVTASAASFP
jgi:hypothetical protein